MRQVIVTILALAFGFGLNAEKVILYNDNGEGGIHKTVGRLVVSEGQYYVDMPIPTYSGKTRIERLKVYRVKDNAWFVYHQDRWAEKYVYAVEWIRGWESIPYFFNMRSPWRPSLTEDDRIPNKMIPIVKVKAYSEDYGGDKYGMIGVVVKMEGSYYFYGGSEHMVAKIYSNKVPLEYAPAWARNYKWRADFIANPCYFNIPRSKKR